MQPTSSIRANPAGLVLALLLALAGNPVVAQTPVPALPGTPVMPVAPPVLPVSVAGATALAAPATRRTQTGTLRRIEMLMREQAEEAILRKGMVPASDTPGMTQGLSGGAPAPAPAAREVPADPLSAYQTVSIVAFDGTATANVMADGVLSTLRLGDKIADVSGASWVVSRISMDGVTAERAHTTKKGVRKFENRTLVAAKQPPSAAPPLDSTRTSPLPGFPTMPLGLPGAAPLLDGASVMPGVSAGPPTAHGVMIDGVGAAPASFGLPTSP